MEISYYRGSERKIENINRRLIIEIEGIEYRLSERNGKLVINKHDARAEPDASDAVFIHPIASNEIEVF